MKLEGKIKHGIALAIDHNDYVDCDVVYYGGMTIRLVNASYDDLSIAFGPVGSYVDMNAFYTKEEIDNKGYLTEHQDISGKADKVDTYTKAETNTLLDAKANVSTTYTKSEVDTLISNVDIDIDDTPTSGSDHAVSSGGVYDSLENKQNTLVSGTNIKTINGVSVLGSGNIDADDVVMGKIESLDFYRVTSYSPLGIPDFSSVAETGNEDKVYVDILTDKVYRWDKKPTAIGESKYKLIGGVDETDPIFTASAAHGITSADIAKWDSKVDSADLASVATSGSYNDLSNKPTIPTVPSNVSAFNNDAGYLTTESDPTVPNHVKGITQQNITNWNNKADSSDLANYYTKSEVNSALDDKQDTITDLATIRSGASLGATAYQKPNGWIPKSDLASSVQTSLGLADSALQQHQDLSSLADGAEYDSSAKKIYLKHGNTRLSNPIDATAFIKDGMIDTVTVTNGNLVISFNTDAGKQPISLPISSIFNANNYYTKTEIDNKGYLTSETDPVFSASVAHGIKSTDIANWNAKQSAIADLDDIRTGASLGATALQSYTETDPTVPAWAKASSKPTYTASEVGALPDTTVIPSKTSDLTNDSGFVTGSKMYIGTCATAAATNPKDCTVETFPLNNGEPLDGTTICVKFAATDTSTSTSPTLNVNNTGAKRIWYNNALLAAAKSSLHHGYANRYIYYVYDSSLDGGNGAWVWLGCGYDSNTTYSNASLGQGYAEDTRSSAVAAVTATISSYALTVGGVVSIHFAYDVPANATMNIRSRGAKAIYYKNAPITAGVIKAGDTATFIYTTYYHLISIDRSEGADLTNYYTKSEVNTALSGKQATLVSGTNIKTFNGVSLLGSGNITKPTYNGSEINYTGTTGNVVTNNTTLNAAIKAIDDAIGNAVTLLSNI